MKILRYFTKSGRYHRWASRNLSYYRNHRLLLMSRQLLKKPLVMDRLVDNEYGFSADILTIPKFGEVDEISG